MTEIGRLAICLALMCALFSVGAAVTGAIRRRRDIVRSSERAAYAVFALVVVAAGILLHALLTHDFSLEYVAAYSSSTLPTNYVVAALWGGQKGSLLFWALVLTFFSTLVHWQNRERNRELMPWVTATLMTIASFFLGLVVFITDPFERLPVPALEGADLNPLLQNYWMMIHPPSLYTGYVSASVPFAFAIAALASGRLGDQWIRTTRRWALFSWFFLTLGNLFGAMWAYEVLGWGGYWAWDPVENAAFMPWLVSTAYLHSVMIQEKKDMLRFFLEHGPRAPDLHAHDLRHVPHAERGHLVRALVHAVGPGAVLHRLPGVRHPGRGRARRVPAA
jgi:cytochrome c-type biogenesis protein CcmF